ncbi:hypothetical protein ACRALDRAFT_1092998 [Sodiomyces alcalophilus JCM 7366]|uniref:uncharacterized protein n=1 Tax=Sodiomyces alcalophilus JCM 7366 TaxID=591952 RepID=UPI0039B4E849
MGTRYFPSHQMAQWLNGLHLDNSTRIPTLTFEKSHHSSEQQHNKPRPWAFSFPFRRDLLIDMAFQRPACILSKTAYPPQPYHQLHDMDSRDSLPISLSFYLVSTLKISFKPPSLRLGAATRFSVFSASFTLELSLEATENSPLLHTRLSSSNPSQPYLPTPTHNIYYT